MLIDDNEHPNSKSLIINLDPPHEDISSNAINFQLSPRALTGHPSPQTLKFKGLISGLPVTILVDSGSSYNILQPCITTHLNLPTTAIPKFSVMVGNRDHIYCTCFYPNVPLHLQNHSFTLPFYLILVEGADVVLGIEWLHTFGPITADFSIPSISFPHKISTLTLTGEPFSLPTYSSFHQICHYLNIDSIASFHILTFTLLHPASTSCNPNSTLNPSIYLFIPSLLN